MVFCMIALQPLITKIFFFLAALGLNSCITRQPPLQAARKQVIALYDL